MDEGPSKVILDVFFGQPDERPTQIIPIESLETRQDLSKDQIIHKLIRVITTPPKRQNEPRSGKKLCPENEEQVDSKRSIKNTTGASNGITL